MVLEFHGGSYQGVLARYPPSEPVFVWDKKGLGEQGKQQTDLPYHLLLFTFYFYYVHISPLRLITRLNAAVYEAANTIHAKDREDISRGESSLVRYTSPTRTAHPTV